MSQVQLFCKSVPCQPRAGETCSDPTAPLSQVHPDLLPLGPELPQGLAQRPLWPCWGFHLYVFYLILSYNILYKKASWTVAACTCEDKGQGSRSSSRAEGWHYCPGGGGGGKDQGRAATANHTRSWEVCARVLRCKAWRGT